VIGEDTVGTVMLLTDCGICCLYGGRCRSVVVEWETNSRCVVQP